MSHAPTPQPRPALRKAPDGSVHPASVLLSSLAVSVPSPGSPDSTGGKKGKKGKKRSKPAPVEATEVVALQVQLAKPVRKALRKRAAEYGWSAEEAAAHVLRVWAEN